MSDEAFVWWAFAVFSIGAIAIGVWATVEANRRYKRICYDLNRRAAAPKQEEPSK